MLGELEAVEAQILKLPAADRARLLDRLILSLDDDKARNDAWDALAAQRDAEIETGQALELDGPDTLARLRAKHA
jgi:hypothetical protein